jgi:DNA polymerase
MIYSIDFETRSKADLPEVGLDNYANHETTEVLCIAFGTDINNVCVATADALYPEEDFLQHVADGGKIQAWNAMFEYAIWNCVCVPKYGWPRLKLEQCIDTMAVAAANNIPQGLDDAGAFMDAQYQKDPIGKRLIQKLCKPNSKGGFNDDPELMRQLFDYCAQDVRTEMALGAVLRPLEDSNRQFGPSPSGSIQEAFLWTLGSSKMPSWQWRRPRQPSTRNVWP